MSTRGKVALAIGAAMLLLVGAFVIIARHQPSEPLAGPRPTLAPGAGDFELIRPFADDVAWNRPVSEFGRSGRYAEYAERFWKYANFGGWDRPEIRGDVDVEFRDYSVPIYDARTATGTKRAFIANFGYPPHPGWSMEVPWNDEWKPAPGRDAFVLSVDPDTGRSWRLWDVLLTNPTTCLTPANLASGYRAFRDLCVGGASMLRDEDGTVGDYRTWNSTQVERGMGIPKLALVTTPYEVREGAIRHALEMTIFTTMFGPACTDEQMGTPAMGVDCGFYLPPATRLEFAETATRDCGPNNQPSDASYRRKTVPEGMRFALDITDDEIEDWLDDRGYTDPLRSTARVFAVALRDYGWIIAETGCFGTSIEVDGMVNPASREVWLELGVPDDDSADQILTGLFTEDRIYVVEPPEPAPSAKEPSPGRAG